MDVGCERGVEGEEAGPIVDEGNGGNWMKSVFAPQAETGYGYTLLLDSICAGARIINHDAVHVVVRRIVSVQHCICNIRHIVSSIALSRDENLPALQRKQIYKVLEEAKKLSSDIGLARSIRLSL